MIFVLRIANAHQIFATMGFVQPCLLVLKILNAKRIIVRFQELVHTIVPLVQKIVTAAPITNASKATVCYHLAVQIQIVL